MTINTLKADLTKVVPMELSTNLDFWFPIRDSIRDTYWAKKFTPIAVPKPFIHYLSHKYNYSLDMLKSEEYVNHIVAIAKKLYDDPKYFTDILLSALPPLIPKNTDFPIYQQPFSTQTIYKPQIKSRDDLVNDTPIAQFVG